MALYSRISLTVIVILLAGSFAFTGSYIEPDNIEQSIVLADDYVYNFEETISAGSYWSLSWDRSQGDGVYGDFDVTSGNDVDFFICDEEEYEKWTNGESASVYHLQEKTGGYSFEFRIPYSDKWYFVFSNTYSLITAKIVQGSLCRDLTPPSIDMNLDSGATYSGIKEITATITEQTFEIGSVTLYIDGSQKDYETDGSFSYSWDTEGYSDGSHTIKLVASDNVGNSDYHEIIVYVSNGASGESGTTGDDNGAYTGESSPMAFSSPIILGFFVLLLIAGIGVVASKRKSEEPATTSDISGPSDFSPTPSSEPKPEPVHSRETIRDRVLVICPYCGAKNEQGITKCQNCSADL